MPAMLLFTAPENASYRREDSLVSPVVFNLGMPVSLAGTNKVAKSSTMTPAPKSVSEPSHLDLSKEAVKFSLTSSQTTVPCTSGQDASGSDTDNGAALDNGSVLSALDICASHSDAECGEEDSSSSVDIHDLKTAKTDDLEEESEFVCKLETLAETSLPWRRQTSLPPVPSSVTSSLPDDENPLMSEAPSWADNLAYSHLTETGSPYTSPQTTIVGRPQETPHRPVFELFPTSAPQPSDSVVSSIPPPWSCKDKVGNDDDEPLPSHSVTGSEAGDKASCLLMSSHDHVPPSYHSCLQPAVNGLDASTFRRHSDVGSPIHFQLMQKLDSASEAAIESHLIGIEEDYLHGMADRVSQWLASSSTGGLNDIDYELANKEEGRRILESLRNKQKLSMEDSEDGTDADVESDNEVFDTKL